MIHHRQSDMNGTSGFTPVTIIYTDGPAKTAHLARKTAFWLRSGRTAEGILTSTRLTDRRTLADLRVLIRSNPCPRPDGSLFSHLCDSSRNRFAEASGNVIFCKGRFQLYGIRLRL